MKKRITLSLSLSLEIKKQLTRETDSDILSAVLIEKKTFFLSFYRKAFCSPICP
jgi:hypothetical protein